MSFLYKCIYSVFLCFLRGFFFVFVYFIYAYKLGTLNNKFLEVSISVSLAKSYQNNHAQATPQFRPEFLLPIRLSPLLLLRGEAGFPTTYEGGLG